MSSISIAFHFILQCRQLRGDIPSCIHWACELEKDSYSSFPVKGHSVGAGILESAEGFVDVIYLFILVFQKVVVVLVEFKDVNLKLNAARWVVNHEIHMG